MKLSTVRKIMLTCMAAILVLIVLLVTTQSDIFIYLLAAFCLVYVVMYFGFDRCPACGKVLHPYMLFIRTNRCPYCGKELDF